LQALAGPPSDAKAPTLKWEGLDLRVDLFAAEHARLKRIREQIESPGLDAALAAGDAEKISNALLALIYTPALGDPEGPALLGADVAQRHNFGLVGPAGMRRNFVAWSLPREQVGDGSPWHVEGDLTQGYRLIDDRSGSTVPIEFEPLRPWLERQRVLGLSAQAIAWELRQATDGEVVVSDQTILNWLAEDA